MFGFCSSSICSKDASYEGSRNTVRKPLLEGDEDEVDPTQRELEQLQSQHSKLQSDFEAESGKASEAAAASSKEITALKASLQQSESELNTQKTQMASTIEQMNTDYQSEIERYKKQIEEATAQLKTTEEKVNSAETKHNQLLSVMAGSDKQAGMVQQQLDSYQREKEENHAEIHSLKADMQTLNEELKEKSGNITQLEADIQTLNNQIEDTSNAMDVKEKELTVLSQSNNTQSEGLQKQISGLEATIEEFRGLLQSKTEECDKLNDQLLETSADLETTKTNLEELQQTLDAKTQESNAQISDLEQQIAKLEENLTSETTAKQQTQQLLDEANTQLEDAHLEKKVLRSEAESHKKKAKEIETQAAAKIKEIKDAEIIPVGLDNVIPYLQSLSVEQLSVAFDNADSRRCGELQLSKDTEVLMKKLCVDCVEVKQLGKQQSSVVLAAVNELTQRLFKVLQYYKFEDHEHLSKQDYDSYFVQIMATHKPTTTQINNFIRKRHDDYRKEDTAAAESTDMPLLSSTSTVRTKTRFDVASETHKLNKIIVDSAPSKRADKLALKLVQYNSEQRLILAEKYVSKDGKSLAQMVDSIMSGNASDLSKLLLFSMTDLDVKWLSKAVKGQKMDIIAEICCSRTKAQLESVQDAYQKQTGHKLLDDICGVRKSDNIRIIFKALLSKDRKENTNVDAEQCKLDAETLKELLGAKKLAKAPIMGVLVERSWHHIRAVCYEYQKISKRDLPAAIKKAMSGSVAGDVLLNYVECSRSLHDYFAKKLRESMKGLGTHDEDLIRVVLSRSEIDLGDIGNVFSRNKKHGDGKTLLQWIKDDCTGAYRDQLLTLAGLMRFEDDDEETKEEEIEEPKNWEDYVASAPCVVPDYTFDGTADSAKLLEVLQQNDSNYLKSHLANLLPRRTNAQRQSLLKEFKANHPQGRGLIYIIEDKLKSDKSKDALLGLLMTSAEYDSLCIQQALDDNDMNRVVDIICCRTNKQLAEIMGAYQLKCLKTLPDAVETACVKKATAAKLLSTILNLRRPETVGVNKKDVRSDVDFLSDKKRKFDGKDKIEFILLFANRSWAHLCELAGKFALQSDVTLNQFIEKCLNKKLSAYCAQTILGMADPKNREFMFAERLKSCMSGITKNRAEIQRLIIARAEIDLLKIRRVFGADFGEGRTLDGWIEETFKDPVVLLGVLRNQDLNTQSQQRQSRVSVAKMKSVSERLVADDKVDDGDIEKVQITEVDLELLGNFLLYRVGEKTTDKVWSRVDKDGSGSVEAKEVPDLLLFTALLGVSYQFSKNRYQKPKVQTKNYKKSLLPLKEWLVTEKMAKRGHFTKSDYTKRMGKWIYEFGGLTLPDDINPDEADSSADETEE